MHVDTSDKGPLLQAEFEELSVDIAFKVCASNWSLSWKYKL
jgi:hypothetical protein